MALPGVLTLLSLLAVVLGNQPAVPDPQPRVTAGTMSPALPELRPVPQPTPGVPLLPAPPPELLRFARPELNADAPRSYAPPQRQPDLSWWGRHQTDGG